METYSLCCTAVLGGTCRDATCHDNHDISRCEPCNCAFPTFALKQHRSGNEHRSNVARNGADDDESLPSGEEEEHPDSGISIPGEDGLNFGIVERMHLDGPFETPTSSLTIRNAEGFPAVTLVEARIKSLFGSDSTRVSMFSHCCLYSLAAPALS